MPEGVLQTKEDCWSYSIKNHKLNRKKENSQTCKGSQRRYLYKIAVKQIVKIKDWRYVHYNEPSQMA
jgi:hypothetical protein